MDTKDKDPAFLFYSKDFYEGTRTMLPEERACYIDLMIYQHQNGCIPNDLTRVLMYCNGVSEATLIATLKAKFKQTPEGCWLNEKLAKVVSEREEFSFKQSINGSVGQFWKKAKAILDKVNYSKLKDSLYEKTNNEIFEIIKDKEITEAMLEALLKHIANANANANANEEDLLFNKGGMGEKPKTWKEDFEVYKQGLDAVYNSLINNKAFIKQREEFLPNVDIVLSLKKAYTDFWGTEKGWRYKKKQRTKDIDWTATLTNAIELNKVYKSRLRQSYDTNKASVDDLESLLIKDKQQTVE